MVVTSWGDSLRASVTNALSMLLGGIPKIIGFAVILIIGWLIASAIAKAVTVILRSVKFNDLAERAGLTGFVHDMGIRTDASSFIAEVVKWFIRLIALVAAFDALGLPAVSAVLQRLLLFLPNVLVALVIVILGGLAAQALSRVVRGATAEAGLGNPDVLARIASIAVWVFAILIAINQLGIATNLVNIAFMGFIGALSLALGLAFGLGGRDTAGKIVETWSRKGQEAAPKISRAAGAGTSQASPPPPTTTSSYTMERRPDR